MQVLLASSPPGGCRSFGGLVGCCFAAVSWVIWDFPGRRFMCIGNGGVCCWFDCDRLFWSEMGCLKVCFRSLLSVLV